MATCTMKQVESWNAKCCNGFHFDIQHFCIWGEKQIKKHIILEDGRVLTATLGYRRVKSANGYSYTGKYRPFVHFQLWNKGANDTLVSHGLGVFVDVGTEQSKQKFNELCKLSAEIDDDKLLDMYGSHSTALLNPCIV